MGRFAHVTKGAKVSKDVRKWFTFAALSCPEGAVDRAGKPIYHPRIRCKPASEVNKPFWQAAQAANIETPGKRTAAENRVRNATLWGEHVVDDWEGVFDEQGNAVEFSTAACVEFLLELAQDPETTWVFTDLFLFLDDPRNFLAENVPSPKAVKEKAGD